MRDDNLMSQKNEEEKNEIIECSLIRLVLVVLQTDDYYYVTMHILLVLFVSLVEFSTEVLTTSVKLYYPTKVADKKHISQSK